jgi:hypothetical protein
MRNFLFTFVTFVVFLFAPALSSAATRIDDPAKFVSGVYAKLSASSGDYAAPEDIYTPHLASLWALEKKESGGEVGRMDFEFWTGTQDWELSGVNVTAQPVEGSNARKIVIAKFKNGGKPEEMHFYFEKSGNGWLLDDVRSLKGETWTLSLILKYGWDSGTQ